MIPTVALPTKSKWAIEGTISHELAHHALEKLNLPLWAEEGLTQMMEDRVVVGDGFSLDQERLERHRARWLNGGIVR